MLTGGLTAHLISIWNQLENRDALLDIELLTFEGFGVAQWDPSDPELQEEDEWAALYGSFVHSLSSKSGIRELYRFGCPHRYIIMMLGVPDSQSYVQTVRQE